MSYLRYLPLLAHSGVQHILCCVLLPLVCSVLLVSLDCHFLTATSIFSNVYLVCSFVTVTVCQKPEPVSHA